MCMCSPSSTIGLGRYPYKAALCCRSQYSLQWRAGKDLKRQQGPDLIMPEAQEGAGTGAAAAAAAAAVVGPAALAALQRPDRAAGPGPTHPAEVHLTGETS